MDKYVNILRVFCYIISIIVIFGSLIILSSIIINNDSFRILESRFNFLYNYYSWYYLYDRTGDAVIITEIYLDKDHYKMLVSINNHNHVFSRPIFNVYGGDFILGVKWRTADVLAVQVGLGPGGVVSQPVRQVGPIHIEYYFLKPGEPAPAPDVPPLVESCPPSYPSLFWHCRKEDHGLIELGRGWFTMG